MVAAVRPRYVGTFSKCLFPALRLGFVVAPPWARDALIRAKMLTDWQTPVLTQDTLAAFISEGHLARHIRRMRKVYQERCTALVGALRRHCGDTVEPIKADTGMHLAAELSGHANAASVVSRAESGGMRIAALSTLTAGKTARNGFVFGYGKIEAKQMDEAVRFLARLIQQEARTPG